MAGGDGLGLELAWGGRESGAGGSGGTRQLLALEAGRGLTPQTLLPLK